MPCILTFAIVTGGLALPRAAVMVTGFKTSHRLESRRLDSGAFTYIGCTAGYWESRPGGNVGTASQGFSATFVACNVRGYTYFGLECPMATQTHCECGGSSTASNMGLGTDCTRSIRHCNNQATLSHWGTVYKLGGHSRGSVYVVSADGTGTAASFRNPVSVAVSPNSVYVADWSDHRIREVNTPRLHQPGCAHLSRHDLSTPRSPSTQPHRTPSCHRCHRAHHPPVPRTAPTRYPVPALTPPLPVRA